MVVFTCQKCNSTLKKNAVEKHFSCRPFFLTCIDCLKDFRGNEYDSHTSCITEAEKYGGGKAVVKQQGVKQEKWAGTAQEILSEISKNPKYHKFCGPLKQASNIPRNRNKFHNFVRNVCSKIYKFEIVNEIFDHLEKAKTNKSDPNSNTTQLNSSSENTIENNENSLQKKKKKKKNKKENENSEKTDESPAQKEDEINSKKRTLIETDFHSNEQQNGTREKKIKHEIKKKKKISSDDPYICEDVNNYPNKENEIEVNGNEPNKSLNEETTSEKLDEESLKLSKKDRKKLKKLQKYKAEVAEILSAQPEENSVSLEEEDNVEKKKKKKKLKNEGKEAETERSGELSPKRKHEKTDIDEEDIAGKKIKFNDTLIEENIQIESGKKFKWGQIIKQVLENSSGNELSLKKLRKKVLNEYWAQKGDDTPYEKLLGTFNKKINSTEGVKVLKDKVQLVLT